MGDGDRDEVEGAPRSEHAVGRRERDTPSPREPRGDRDQVLLRHADIEEALGKRLLERQNVGVFAEVCGQRDDFRPIGAERG